MAASYRTSSGVSRGGRPLRPTQGLFVGRRTNTEGQMMRHSLGMLGVSVCVLCGSISFLCLLPSAHAADGDAAEAAPVEATPTATVEYLQQAIEAETDPELN